MDVPYTFTSKEAATFIDPPTLGSEFLNLLLAIAVSAVLLDADVGEEADEEEHDGADRPDVAGQDEVQSVERGVELSSYEIKRVAHAGRFA